MEYKYLKKRYVDSARHDWTKENHRKMMNQKKSFYHWKPDKIKVTIGMASYLRYNVTIVTSTAT